MQYSQTPSSSSRYASTPVSITPRLQPGVTANFVNTFATIPLANSSRRSTRQDNIPYSYTQYATDNIQIPNFPSAQPSAQAIWSSYSNRLKEGNTSLLLPIISRRRTRGAGVNVNYAEDGLSDDPEFWEEELRGIATADKTGGGRQPFERERSEKPVQRRLMRKTRHVYRSAKDTERMAEQKEFLIPIHLDIDFESHKLRDTFTWNLNEKLITPEIFAEILCNDLDIPAEIYVPTIAEAIRTQVSDHEATAERSLPEEDNRVIINLDVQVGRLNLRDRFEWDLSSDFTPEEFSRKLTADLGVGGEFAPMIAFNIHEQLLRHKKEKLEDSDGALEPLKSAFRPIEVADQWAPVLETLTAEELEKVVLDKERSIRRLRRETSRFGSSIRPRALRTTTSRLSNVTTLLPESPPRSGKIERSKPERAARLAPEELEKWFCEHCGINGRDTPLVRKGPSGLKTLCNACGLYWITKSKLPDHRKNMFAPQRGIDHVEDY